MVTRIFSWLAGLTLVMVFLVAISPDLFRDKNLRIFDAGLESGLKERGA